MPLQNRQVIRRSGRDTLKQRGDSAADVSSPLSAPTNIEEEPEINDAGHDASHLSSPRLTLTPPPSIPSPQRPTNAVPLSTITALADSEPSPLPTNISTSTKAHTSPPPPPPPPFPSESSYWTNWDPFPEKADSTATIFITKTTSLSPSSTGEPTLLPQPTSLPSINIAGRTSETMAVKAVVIIISAFLFLAICFISFRFCPPLRNRWLAFKERKEHNRLKRLGMEDLQPTIVVTATPAIARSREERYAPDGPRMTMPLAAARRLGVNAADTEAAAGDALPQLRPPSYRSNWTASGASWVANGFRLPERFSQRARRSQASGGGDRRWFGVSDGANLSSSDSESQRTSLGARISTMSSGSQRASRGRGLDELSERLRDSSYASTEWSTTVSNPRTRRTSQMSEVSRMSSRWSEQRLNVAMTPSTLFNLPVQVPK